MNTSDQKETPVTGQETGRVLDFYFDFISPFGFFASLRIDDLAARYGYQVRWHSMLIGVSVLKVMGMKPLLETPLKGPYIVKDAIRYARQHHITPGRPFDAPVSDPRPAAKAFHWLNHYYPLESKRFAQKVFAAYWLEGKDIAQQAVLSEVLQAINLHHQVNLDDLGGEEAAARLRAEVSQSLEKGVFGSPYFIVGDEPFFGLEKLELLENWLATGGW